jgi:hypothetical protein
MTPIHRRKDNIKTDLQEIGYTAVEWIKLIPLMGFCDHTGELSEL